MSVTLPGQCEVKVKFETERVIPDRLECLPAMQTHMARYRFAAPFVQRAMVLDAGCGCGYGTHHLAISGAEWATGVDVAPEAIEYAQRHYSAANLDYRKMDVTALDFPAATFDAVVCLEVFEHVPDQHALLAEARRVLKPGGRIIVSTPNGRIFSPKGSPINPWHVREFSRDEFRRVLTGYFQELEIWGQTVRSSLALPFTLFHLRMQRYITTSKSRLSRLVEIGYERVRATAMLMTRYAIRTRAGETNAILKSDTLPDSRTWYFVAVGRKSTRG